MGALLSEAVRDVDDPTAGSIDGMGPPPEFKRDVDDEKPVGPIVCLPTATAAPCSSASRTRAPSSAPACGTAH